MALCGHKENACAASCPSQSEGSTEEEVTKKGCFLGYTAQGIGVISLAAARARGRFRYGRPGEMKQVANETLCGYVTHYAIGVSLALPCVFGWLLSSRVALV